MRNPIPAGQNRIALAAVAGMLAVMFIGAILPTPLYPLYREAFGFSTVTLTLIYATYVLGNLTALLLFGRLADQIGPGAGSPAATAWIAELYIGRASGGAARIAAAANFFGCAAGPLLGGLFAQFAPAPLRL